MRSPPARTRRSALTGSQIFTDPGLNTVFPDVPTGWQADPFSLRTFTVPHHWTAGRIWVRPTS